MEQIPGGEILEVASDAVEGGGAGCIRVVVSPHGIPGHGERLGNAVPHAAEADDGDLIDLIELHDRTLAFPR